MAYICESLYNYRLISDDTCAQVMLFNINAVLILSSIVIIVSLYLNSLFFLFMDNYLNYLIIIYKII
jgi:hypothetical protein